MNLKEIRDEVKLLVQDSSFSDNEVTAWINTVLGEVCGRCLLPSLKRVGTVSTSTSDAYVSIGSLTGGFSGRLVRVIRSPGVEVEIVPSLELLFDEYGDLSGAGDVEKCCIEGNVLWYAKIPEEASSLTLLYFCAPFELVTDDDIPSELPDFLHRHILVNGAAAIGYDLIEGGEVDENVRVNTRVYSGQRDAGVTKLQEWLGRNKKHFISSVWRV
jgi:hypothetical protein